VSQRLECSNVPDGVARPEDPLGHFARMIPNCLEYARAQKAAGHPIVGIMCEFTPREIIMAAGGVPVCLCGGSASTVTTAEEVLPANLCPLVKSTFGYHLRKSNPFLEMADLIVAETTCDAKKKMFELMGESRPMLVLELPQKQADETARAHWVEELRRFAAELERRFGVRISAGHLRSAMATMNRERRLRRELAALMAGECPVMTGRQLLDLKSSISGIPVDLDQYERCLRLLQARGVSAEPVPGGSAPRPSPRPVRVLLTGVPIVHGAERVVDIIEARGGLIVCMENCTGLKPILEDVDETAGDPLLAIADKYYHLPCSVMTPNAARMDSLTCLATAYRAECIVELVWQACLTYDVETHQVRRLAEQTLDLPYLRIETDYSPADTERIATRVEALVETVRTRRPATS
jgi:benzoyl-CoA reductase/2-hydroxyglutaryl-CoA dehydratase subunit BcrC/BadD/HgdB